MARRRELGVDQAGRLIRDSERSGQPIEGIIFPPMVFRARRLQSVTFVDCDVGQLSFSGPFLRAIELVGCRLINCSGPHHVTYRRIRFLRCQWNAGTLNGVFESCELSETRLMDVEVDDLSIVNCRLDDIVMGDLHGRGLTIQDCSVKKARILGRVEQVNLIDLRVDDVDLSAFHVIDGGLLGIAGEMRLPDFKDSFVVSADAVHQLKPSLRTMVRPEAHATLDLLVSDGFALEWFDPRRLDALPDSGLPRLLPEEQSRVLHSLWKNRLLEQPGVSSR